MVEDDVSEENRETETGRQIMWGFVGQCKDFREGNGTPLRTLAWKIPWTEEPGRLQLQRVGHE